MADFNESIILKEDVNYNRIKSVFDDKEIVIAFHMILKNGSPLVGEVYFNLAGKDCSRNYENIQIIQKCSQKNSKVFFTFVAEIIAKNRKNLIINKNGHFKSNEAVIKSIKDTYSPSNTQ
jgi:hypothetical protein